MLALAPEQTYLLAISGGGDSMALAHMAKQQGLQVAWAHINHGWHASDKAAAHFVAEQAKAYGIDVHTITLEGGKPTHNAEAHARTARYAFFKELCTQYNYAGVVLAHTQTDIAETFLMRAGKGSGVSGLAAMQPVTVRNGLTIYRPLLNTSREDLRAYLTQHNQTWAEDFDNTSLTNQRARVRALLPKLEAAGIPVHGLAAAAQALARAEHALAAQGQIEDPANAMPLEPILAKPQETALRQIASVLRHHLPHQLPPRTGKRMALLAHMQESPSGKATLGGLVWRWHKGWLKVWPEHRPS